jgi:hypothetical protein
MSKLQGLGGTEAQYIRSSRRFGIGRALILDDQ